MTTPPPPGPCSWTIDTGCIPNLADYSAEDIERATVWATFILDGLTGHQFGQCPVTVRPCGDGCRAASGYQTWPAGTPGPWMTPYIGSTGAWRNCMCGGGCSCLPACRALLGAPVAEITEVKVNGLVLDPSAYVMVGQHLARVDGGECWPSCQDPAVPDTEDGTFSVTLQPGRLLPRAGEIAAGALAAEFLKACAGAACGLPAQVASLSRQGVDVEFVSPTDVLTDGLTGIRDVDLFVRAVNPSGLQRRSRVLSPDLPKAPVNYG
ncbi:MAG TPA: hypothetical protein VFX97_20605 [Pyrinomonadaceae bacterium]|nr:hypothetical protein [Pyrinomonadaceae bacterium]